MLHKNAKYLAAVAVVAIVGLAGCGRGETSAATEAAPTAGTGTATGTVVMWAQGASGNALPELVKGFEAENPGVKVEVTGIPWSAAHQKYETAVAGGTVPDVAQMGTTYLADFDHAFEAPASDISTGDMFQGAKDAAVVKGQSVGIPWYVATRVIYYRTDLAAQAGFSAAPKDREGFKAMAKALQTKAGAKFGVQLPTGGTDSFQAFLPFGWSNGATLMNTDQSKWTLDGKEMTDALAYYKSYFTEGIADFKSPLPDALVCRTDSHALELLDALAERRVSVPGDVIVTGFDGITAGLLSSPRLTTVRQPMISMGIAAVELLMKRFASPTAKQAESHFPVELTLHESCGC